MKENRQGSVDHPRRAATDTFPRNQMGSGAARYSAHGAANQIWALSGLSRVGPGPAGGGAKPAARLALGPAHGAGAGHWLAAEGWAPPGHRFIDSKGEACASLLQGVPVGSIVICKVLHARLFQLLLGHESVIGQACAMDYGVTGPA